MVWGTVGDSSFPSVPHIGLAASMSTQANSLMAVFGPPTSLRIAQGNAVQVNPWCPPERICPRRKGTDEAARTQPTCSGIKPSGIQPPAKLLRSGTTHFSSAAGCNQRQNTESQLRSPSGRSFLEASLFYAQALKENQGESKTLRRIAVCICPGVLNMRYVSALGCGTYLPLAAAGHVRSCRRV